MTQHEPGEPADVVRTIAVMGSYSAHHEAIRPLVGVMNASDEAKHLIVPFDHFSGAVAPARKPPVQPMDGAVFLSLPVGDEMAAWIERQQVHTVLYDFHDTRYHNIIVDHVAAAAEAGRYLLERGHHRIGFIGHRQQHNYDGQSRQKIEGLTRALPFAPEVLVGELSVADGRRMAMSMLDHGLRPTAIFAHNDELAAGALAAARELGLDVPGDVAVIGFNDTAIAEALDITTFAQPYEEAGAEALHLLERIFETNGDDEVARHELVLTPKLVMRSTA